MSYIHLIVLGQWKLQRPFFECIMYICRVFFYAYIAAFNIQVNEKRIGMSYNVEELSLAYSYL